jgi:hypothetical protein
MQGFKRCGKSCRLRWVNHLRGGLKKTALSPEEERCVLELHTLYGNKWVRTQLLRPCAIAVLLEPQAWLRVRPGSCGGAFLVARIGWVKFCWAFSCSNGLKRYWSSWKCRRGGHETFRPRKALKSWYLT